MDNGEQHPTDGPYKYAKRKFQHVSEQIIFSMIAAFISMYVFAQSKKESLTYELFPSLDVIAQLADPMARDFLKLHQNYRIDSKEVDPMYAKMLESTYYSKTDFNTIMVRLIGLSPKEKSRSISEDFLKPYYQCIDDFTYSANNYKKKYESAAFLSSKRGLMPNDNLALYKQIAKQGGEGIAKRCIPFVESLSVFSSRLDVERDILDQYQKVSAIRSAEADAKNSVDQMFQRIASFRDALYVEKERISISWLPDGNSHITAITDVIKNFDAWRSRCLDGERSSDEVQYCIGSREELGELLKRSKDVNEGVRRAIQEHYRHTQTMGEILWSFLMIVLIVFIPFRPRLSVVDMFTGTAKSSSGALGGS